MEDEEFCAIPMGGVLPMRPQRVIGIGGTAGAHRRGFKPLSLCQC